MQMHIFPYPETPNINILYGWTERLTNLNYVFYRYIFLLQSKLNIFVLFYYIVTFNFFFLRVIITRSVRICFYQINWLHFFLIWSNLINFFSKHIMLFTSKSLLHSYYYFIIFYEFFIIFFKTTSIISLF